jgi:hypothetical protein
VFNTMAMGAQVLASRLHDAAVSRTLASRLPSHLKSQWDEATGIENSNENDDSQHE